MVTCFNHHDKSIVGPVSQMGKVRPEMAKLTKVPTAREWGAGGGQEAGSAEVPGQLCGRSKQWQGHEKWLGLNHPGLTEGGWDESLASFGAPCPAA